MWLTRLCGDNTYTHMCMCDLLRLLCVVLCLQNVCFQSFADTVHRSSLRSLFIITYLLVHLQMWNCLLCCGWLCCMFLITECSLPIHTTFFVSWFLHILNFCHVNQNVLCPAVFPLHTLASSVSVIYLLTYLNWFCCWFDFDLWPNVSNIFCVCM